MQERISDLVYRLVPNLEVFNVRGAVVHGDPVTWAHLGWATIYGLGWTGLLLILAGSVFSRRELR